MLGFPAHAMAPRASTVVPIKMVLSRQSRLMAPSLPSIVKTLSGGCRFLSYLLCLAH